MRLSAAVAGLLFVAGCGGGGDATGFGQDGSAKVKNPPPSNESIFVKRPGAGSKNMGMAYQEGFNAGRKAATDFNMNWMLNWDKEAAWRTEYDRGWKEGRNLRRLQDERAKKAGA